MESKGHYKRFGTVLYSNGDFAGVAILDVDTYEVKFLSHLQYLGFKTSNTVEEFNNPRDIGLKYELAGAEFKRENIKTNDTLLYYLWDKDGKLVFINADGKVFEYDGNIVDIECGIANLATYFKHHDERLLSVNRDMLKGGYVKVLSDGTIQYENTGYKCIDFSECSGKRVLSIPILGDALDGYVIVVGKGIDSVIGAGHPNMVVITLSSSTLVLVDKLLVRIADDMSAFTGDCPFIQRDTSTKFWHLNGREISKLKFIGVDVGALLASPVYLNYKEALAWNEEETHLIDEIQTKFKPAKVNDENALKILAEADSWVSITNRKNMLRGLRLLISSREDVKDMLLIDGKFIEEARKVYTNYCDIGDLTVRVITISLEKLGLYTMLFVDLQLYAIFDYSKKIQDILSASTRRSGGSESENLYSIKVGDKINLSYFRDYQILGGSILRVFSPHVISLDGGVYIMVESGQCFKMDSKTIIVEEIYSSYEEATQHIRTGRNVRCVGREALKQKLKLEQLFKEIENRGFKETDEILYEYTELTKFGKFILSSRSGMYPRERYGLSDEIEKAEKRVYLNLPVVRDAMIKARKAVGITSMDESIKVASSIHDNVPYIAPFGVKDIKKSRFYMRFDEVSYINLVNGEINFCVPNTDIVIRLKTLDDYIYISQRLFSSMIELDKLAESMKSRNRRSTEALYLGYNGINIDLPCWDENIDTRQRTVDDIRNRMFIHENKEIAKMIEKYGFVRFKRLEKEK